MAGGYGGQLLALDVADNQFNLANPLEAASKLLQSQATTNQTKAETDEAKARLAVDAAQLPAITAEAQQRQARAGLGMAQTQDALIARAASQIDPTDPQAATKWDASMQSAVEAGAKDANQFVGKFTPALHQRVAQSYGAASALEAATASAAGGMPSSGFSPQQAQQWDTMFQSKSPQELSSTVQKLDTYRQALQRVLQSKDPAAQWSAEAQTLGHDQAMGAYNPMRVQQLWSDVAPMESYLQSKLAKTAAGVPAPIPDTKVMEANGGIFGVRQTPAGPKAEFLGGAPQMSAPGAAQGLTLHDFASKITGIENTTGNPGARNPLSSATGDGQFIDGTWLRLMKANHPDLTQGKTDQQVLGMRSDPALSSEMTADYAVENAAALSQAGQPVNSATLALSHRFGVGDAQKLLVATPNTPMSTVLSKKVLQANPGLQGQTVGGYVANLVQRVGADPVQVAAVTPGMKANTAGDLATGGATGAQSHGPDYLKSLTPQMAQQVQALAEGRQQFPSGMALTKPYWQQMITAVGQYDPTFNQSDYNARAKTRAAFTSGPPAANITSYNTSIGHLEDLDHSIDALHNTPFDWINKPTQWIKSKGGDHVTQKAISDFNASKGAVAGELVKSFRGSPGNLDDVQYWKNLLDQAASPDALHAVVQKAGSLLRSRIDAVQQQYNTGMGTSNETVPGLTPHALQALTRIEQGGGAQSASQPPAIKDRVPGKTYPTPKGPATWTLNGWVMADASH